MATAIFAPSLPKWARGFIPPPPPSPEAEAFVSINFMMTRKFGRKGTALLCEDAAAGEVCDENAAEDDEELLPAGTPTPPRRCPSPPPRSSTEDRGPLPHHRVIKVPTRVKCKFCKYRPVLGEHSMMYPKKAEQRCRVSSL